MKSKRIKPLFVTRSFPPIIGGMENYAYLLFKGLSEDDKLDVKLLANHLGRAFLPLFFIKTLFYSLIFGYKFDVFYANDVLTSFFLIPSKLLYKRKIITTVYGLDILYNQKQQHSPVSKILQYIYKYIYKISIKNIDEIVSISNATKNLLKKIIKVNSVVIQPGIETENINLNTKIKTTNKENILKIIGYKNIDKSNSKEIKIILFIGRLVKRKGIDWFAKNVFPKLNNSYILLIAGNGPLYNKLHKIKLLIEKQQKRKGVFILGHVDEKLKEKLLLGSDLMIFPNINSTNDFEGFGISNIEAGKYGLPVVSSNVDGIVDAVHNGKNGHLFNEKDISDCISCIKKSSFLDGESIINFIRQNFSYKIMSKKYQSLMISD